MLLKDHIKLLTHVKADGDISDLLEKYKGLERVKMARAINDSYPLDIKDDDYKKLETEFNVYPSINDLVLGQFIMVEQIITGKTKLPEHLVDLEILKLILRPKHHNVFDNEDLQEEKKNQEHILNTDIHLLYSLINRFVEDRNKVLFNDFSGVFYDSLEEDEEEEQEAKEEKTAKAVFNQQWYWYSIVRLLAGEDIHRYEQTYMLPMSVVLPEMSYLAQKSKIDSANQRQQQAMRKL